MDVFRVNFDNYIQSFTYTPPGATQSISILANVGKAVNEGIAWQNNFQIDKNWSAYANLGLLNAQFTSAKVPMPYSPHSTLALGGIYTVGPWRTKLGVRHTSEAYWTDFKSPIPAHTIADASVRYTFDPARFIRESRGIFHTRILEELFHALG